MSILIVLIKCLHTIVVCFRTMCSYSDQVEDVEHNNASIEGVFHDISNGVCEILVN